MSRCSPRLAIRSAVTGTAQNQEQQQQGQQHHEAKKFRKAQIRAQSARSRTVLAATLAPRSIRSSSLPS